MYGRLTPRTYTPSAATSATRLAAPSSTSFDENQCAPSDTRRSPAASATRLAAPSSTSFDENQNAPSDTRRAPAASATRLAAPSSNSFDGSEYAPSDRRRAPPRALRATQHRRATASTKMDTRCAIHAERRRERRAPRSTGEMRQRDSHERHVSPPAHAHRALPTSATAAPTPPTAATRDTRSE